MRLFGQKAKKSVSDNNYALNGLRQNCDPEPLIRLVTGTDRADVHKKVLPLLTVNGLWALVAGGLGAAALSPLLRWRDQLDGSRGNDLSRCQCHLLLSEAYAQAERWQEAVAEQNRAMEYYGKLTEAELADDVFRWMLCRSGYSLRLHLGRTEGLEPLLLQLLDSAPDPWRLAEGHLLLGSYYMAVGEKGKAEEHLTYTASRGNRLYAKKQAEKLLRELRGEGPNGEDLAQQAQREMRKLSDPLNPQPALEICLEALVRPEVQGEPEWTALLRLDAAADLVNLGKYAQALEHLALIPPDLPLLSQPPVKMRVLHLSLLARMELGRLEEAEALQREAVELFTGAEGLEPYRRTLTRTGYELRVRRGHPEGVEAEAGKLLDAATEELDRLSAHMLLARCYLAEGRGDQARPHLEYVVERAKNHHFRRDAEGLLGEMK